MSWLPKTNDGILTQNFTPQISIPTQKLDLMLIDECNLYKLVNFFSLLGQSLAMLQVWKSCVFLSC
jgi:hypothetical protein